MGEEDVARTPRTKVVRPREVRIRMKRRGRRGGETGTAVERVLVYFL